MAEFRLGQEWLTRLHDVPTVEEAGEYRLPQSVSATTIESRAIGLCFGEEMPLEFRIEARRIRDWKRFRLEFKTSDRAHRGSSLVIAWKPDSLRFYQAAEFKGPYRKGPLELEYKLGTEVKTETLESLRNEPTETGSASTAVFNEPVGFFDNNPHRQVRARAFCLGLSSAYEDTKAQLQESAEIVKLWKLTESRQLRFAPSSVQSNKPIRIYEELIPECYALLMELAISQSLAGPGDADSWAGRKVADLVEQVYKGHVNNLNRRHWRLISQTDGRVE